MSRHTPGPWKVVKETTRLHGEVTFYVTAQDPDSPRSGRLEVPIHIGLAGGNSRTMASGRTEANAHLAAASPDLLAVVKKTLVELERLAPTRAPPHPLMNEQERRQRDAAFEFLDRLIAEHHAAIAKAEGKS